MLKCKNDPRSWYKGTEPSPKGLGYCAHAERIGKIRVGRDNNKWKIVLNSRGIKRWQLLTQKRETKSKVTNRHTRIKRSPMFQSSCELLCTPENSNQESLKKVLATSTFTKSNKEKILTLNTTLRERLMSEGIALFVVTLSSQNGYYFIDYAWDIVGEYFRIRDINMFGLSVSFIIAVLYYNPDGIIDKHSDYVCIMQHSIPKAVFKPLKKILENYISGLRWKTFKQTIIIV